MGNLVAINKPVFHRSMMDDEGGIRRREIFGEVGASVIMNQAHVIMRGLCENWRTGEWHAFSLSNGGFFMAPMPDQQQGFLFQYDKNNLDAVVTSHSAGAIVFLCVYLHLSRHHTFKSAVCAEQYRLLREYVEGLRGSEKALILMASA